MQSLEQQITEQTRGLPEDAQREILHYIEFLRSRYISPALSQSASGETKRSWSETALYGLWRDREDMQDPTAYVRELRRPRF